MKKKDSFLLRTALFLRPFLFGKTCPGCGELIRVFPTREIFCEECLQELENSRFPEPDTKHLPSFLPIYIYRGAVRKAMLSFKFRGERNIGLFFADRMTEALRKFQDKPPDLVCCVPCYALKDGRRYNQTEVLAERIAENLNIPFEETLLLKIKDIKSQTKTKNRQERLQNPKGAYAFNRTRSVTGKTVLLIDDVATTGSTLRECTEELYRAGAFFVCRMTIAKTLPFSGARLVPSNKNREKIVFRRLKP